MQDSSSCLHHDARTAPVHYRRELGGIVVCSPLLQSRDLKASIRFDTRLASVAFQLDTYLLNTRNHFPCSLCCFPICILLLVGGHVERGSQLQRQGQAGHLRLQGALFETPKLVCGTRIDSLSQFSLITLLMCAAFVVERRAGLVFKREFSAARESFRQLG